MEGEDGSQSHCYECRALRSRFFSLIGPASAAKRLAFVVGIDRYDNLSNDVNLFVFEFEG